VAKSSQSGSRSSGVGSKVDVPKDFANVAPQSPMLDHSFTLQSILDLHRSVERIATKTDRLIDDVKGHGTKIDELRMTIARWTGVILLAAILLPIIAKFAIDRWFN
jgi:hypothetical protein